MIDQALGGLPDHGGGKVRAMLARELPDAGIIHIGRTDADGFFTRTLVLTRDAAGPCLTPPPRPEAPVRRTRRKAPSPVS